MKHKPLTRSQWIGAAVLLAMIIIVQVFIHIVPQRPVALQNLTERDQSLMDSTTWKRRTYRHWRKDTIDIVLQPFDPNTADSITLVHLGLRPWQVKNLLKYRAHHGVFRKKEDLKKLYQFDDSLYVLLEPYIDIDTNRFIQSCDSFISAPIRYKKSDTIVDINTADTVTLQKIRYIGKTVAREIIRYREQLGGYVSVSQIREIEALQMMDKDTTILFWMDSILPYLEVRSDSVHKILINRTGMDRLVKHPYLRYDQAESIYQYRRRHIRIQRIEEIRDLLPDSTYQRIVPYLSLDDK